MQEATVAKKNKRKHGINFNIGTVIFGALFLYLCDLKAHFLIYGNFRHSFK